MLRFHAWRQQQQQKFAAGLVDKAAAGTTASWSPAALSAQAAAARRAAARARTMLQPLERQEGHFSLPLACKLLPSTVRRAQQLLAKGRAVDALLYLCPGSTSVLLAYAAKSHDLALMQQLLKHYLPNCALFPQHWFDGCEGSGMYLRTDLACSYAALASGDLQMLRQLLLCEGTLGKTWRGRLLLCYAARHSSAECLQEVLAARQLHATFVRSCALVAPQHLAMAAARTDPWAAGAVSQLLQALNPKQRKPANMRPAYKAACSSDCMPVLAVLAGVAAAAPRQQLPVLLEAAAEAGNLQVWHQLLQADGSNQQQQQQQQEEREEEPQQEAAAAAAAALPLLDWSCLSLQQLTSALHLALPKTNGGPYHEPGTSQQQQWQATQDAARLQMADLLWQQLVVRQGREAALRQHLRAPAPAKHRGTQHPAAAAAGAAAAASGASSAVPAANANSKVLFSYTAGAGHYLQSVKQHEVSAARITWLQQHQLVPKEQQHVAYHSLRGAVELAMEAGDFTRALQLHSVLTGSAGVRLRKLVSVRAADAFRSSIGGHLRRACAAGDAAAVAQLERLVCFAHNIFAEKKQTLQHPVLQRSLLGSFCGRAVTPGSLAEELGLPWPLLQRLLMQRVDYFLARSDGLSTVEQYDVRRGELVASVQDTMMLAQDDAATAQQLQSAAGVALATAVQTLRENDANDGGTQAELVAGGADAAGNAAAVQQQQQPLDPMQQLVNQLNAGLQLQNQAGAQAEAALQQLQQIVQELQQAGAPEEEIADIAAQGIANMGQAQPQEQAQPEALPTEDHSPAAVLRQLQARLEAGERSIPVPQQAQLGPLPLWQQCLLEVASNLPSTHADPIHPDRVNEYLTSGTLVADSPAAARHATPLQRLLGDAGFVTGPPVPPQPQRLWWGKLVVYTAVELHRPQLLAWALQPEQRHRLWGSAHNAAKAALVECMWLEGTPFSNKIIRQPEQQRADLLQLEMHQQQQLPGRPAFAELAAETALLLLNVSPNDEGLLSDWLQRGLQPGSSAAFSARAKAVLAAVVAAEQLPAGAQLMRRQCLLQVQRLGDVDLLALVVLRGHRLPQVLRADNMLE
eukprot:jgi/Sobl393_1/1743/SZX61423.1